MGLQVAFQVAGLAFSAISAFNQSSSQKSAYAYQAAVNRNNAQIAKWQADDALRRSNEEAAALHRKNLLLKGNQTATLASRGLDLNSGSAWNTLSDTELFGYLDEQKTKFNGERQAWAFENQANNYSNDANMLQTASDNTSPWKAAAGTMLSGAGAVADSWYKLNPSTPSGGSSGGIKLNMGQVDKFWSD